MSPALSELCRLHPGKDERLLAASSLIVKLEDRVSSYAERELVSKANVKALRDTVMLLLEILRNSREIYPEHALLYLDNISRHAYDILRKVQP